MQIQVSEGDQTKWYEVWSIQDILDIFQNINPDVVLAYASQNYPSMTDLQMSGLSDEQQAIILFQALQVYDGRSQMDYAIGYPETNVPETH